MLARGSERETGYNRVTERTLNPRVSGPRWGGGSLRAGAFPREGTGRFLGLRGIWALRMGRIRIFGPPRGRVKAWELESEGVFEPGHSVCLDGEG